MEEEEIFSGQLKGQADNNEVANMPDAVVVDFDAENTDDGEKAQDLARSIKIEFEPNDVVFWFSQLEGEMTMATVNSQWLKKPSYSETYPLNKKKMSKLYYL